MENGTAEWYSNYTPLGCINSALQFTKHIQIIGRNVLFLLLLEVNTVAGGSVSLPGDPRAAAWQEISQVPIIQTQGSLLLQPRLTSTWSPCADVNNHQDEILVFFLNLSLIFPCFLSTLEFIQGQYLPSFYNSIFAEATTVVLKFSKLSVTQVLFKTAHFRGIPHTMLLNEHKNHHAFLKSERYQKI